MILWTFLQPINVFKCEKTICLYCLRAKDNVDHKNCKTYYKAYLCLQIYSKICFSFNCLKCNSNLNYFNVNTKVLAKIRQCNHITCQKCNVITCYICSGAGLVDHGTNYLTDVNRCPMYLYDLKNVPELSDWPSTDSQAHDKFNEYRKKTVINKIINLYGQDFISKVYENYSHLLIAIDKDTLKFHSDLKPIKYLEDRIYRFYKIS